MDVSLTPELERLVIDKVESGLYTSPSEVVGEALRLLDQRDQARANRLAALKRDIAVGVEQSKRGDVMDAEAFFEELLQETRAEASSKRVE
jgi:antitoxin ParD1/3/4